MSVPQIRILLVEDSEDDAELVLRELRRGNFDVVFHRVESREDMAQALERSEWDLVLSDYSLPRFDALKALDTLKQSKRDLPFIVVSGTIGEDTAVAAMRSGAHDFILKDNLVRLIPAVEREIREARGRAEQRRLQEQLVLSDRMASVGMLAAGVAHEINNPLAAVLANIDFVREGLCALHGKYSELGELAEAATDATEAAQRVRQIVRDVKIFSRGTEDRLGAVDVHRVLDSTVRMAWNELRYKSQVVKNYGKIRPVLATESRMGQVFLNLIVNAAQAMVSRSAASKNQIRVSTAPTEDGQVVIEIADNGPGIPAEIQNRLFTPFFTTKAPGLGTGLGLSICRRIVESLGGRIDLYSVVDEGTTVRVTLPTTEQLPSLRQSSPTLSAFGAIRRGRILVIDDEIIVTTAVRRILGPAHDVLIALNARAALQKVTAGETFDLILCDVMMPDMTGIDFQRALADLAPEQAGHLVFMTGGVFSDEIQRTLDEGKTPSIEKSFDRAALLALANEWVR